MLKAKQSLRPYDPVPARFRHDKAMGSPRQYGEWRLVWVPKNPKVQDSLQQPNPTPAASGADSLPPISRRAASVPPPEPASSTTNPHLPAGDSEQHAAAPRTVLDMRGSLASVIKERHRKQGPVAHPPFVTAAWRHVCGGTRFLPPDRPDMIDERRQALLQPVVRERSRQEILDCARHYDNLKKKRDPPRRQRRHRS